MTRTRRILLARLPVSLDQLRNALADHHLPCIVKQLPKSYGVSVEPGEGIARRDVEIFVKGFLAGFNA